MSDTGRDASRSPKPVLAGALAFFVLCALVQTVGMARVPSPYDEGLILTGAMRVAHGQVPHRDFYANYGPGQFYVLAALFKLFGPSVLIERLWDAVVRAATAAVAYALVRRVASRDEVTVAAGLVTIWLVGVGYEGFPVFPALLCALVGALCLVPFFEGRAARGWLVAAGLAAGAATLFRYDAGFYVVVAEGIVVAAHGFLRGGPPGPRLRRIGIDLLSLGAGVALVCVPVAFVYAATGALADFRFDVLVYPSTFYWRMRSLPFPRLADLSTDFTGFAIYMPILAWAAAAVATLRGGRADPAARIWLVGFLALLSALFYVKGVVRVSLIHMILSIIPALLAVVLLFPLVRVARNRSVRIAAVALATLFILLPTGTLIRASVTNIAAGLAWATAATTWAPASAATPARLAPCHPQAYLGRMACFALPDKRAAAIRYVAEHSRPDEPIFVGAARHDVVFANDNLFYFLADRLPATKWSHYDPGLQSSAPIQREMIAELRAAAPRFVVVTHDFDTPPSEPNESGRSSGVTLLDDFLRTAYAPVRTFGSADVLERKP